MKKEVKIGGLVVGLIVLIGISFVLYNNGLMNYLIITGTLCVICAIVLVNTLITTRSDEAQYKSKLRQILRTYDSILVKSKNLPKLDDLNIIRVDTIEDLVDAQMEIRKPIYYQEQTESCAFVLLDNMTACFYTLKVNDAVLCPLEITINELDLKSKINKRSLEEDIPEDLLSEIERTTIIRLKKGKYVKVSPLRKNNKQQANKAKEKVNENTVGLTRVIEEAKKVVEETGEKVNDTIKETKNKVDDIVEKVNDKKDNAADIIQEKAEEIKNVIDEKTEVAKENVTDAKEKIENKLEEAKDAISDKTEDIKEVIEEKAEVAKESIIDAKEKVEDKIAEAKDTISDKTKDIKEVVADKIEEVTDKVDEIKKDVESEKKKNKAKNKTKKIANNAIDKAYEVKNKIEELTLEDDRNIIEKTIDKVDQEIDKAKTKANVDKKIDNLVDNIADIGKKYKPKEKKKREIEELDF